MRTAAMLLVAATAVCLVSAAPSQSGDQSIATAARGQPQRAGPGGAASPDSDLVFETFRSPAVRLRSGQIANTPSTFGPLPMPKGKVRHF